MHNEPYILMTNERTEHFYGLTLEGFHDEEMGDVDGPGWFALFRYSRIIIHVDSQGFKHGGYYETPELVESAWEWGAELVAEYDGPEEFQQGDVYNHEIHGL